MPVAEQVMKRLLTATLILIVAGSAARLNYREKSMSILRGIGDGTFKPAVTTPHGFRSHQGQWISHRHVSPG